MRKPTYRVQMDGFRLTIVESYGERVEDGEFVIFSIPLLPIFAIIAGIIISLGMN